MKIPVGIKTAHSDNFPVSIVLAIGRYQLSYAGKKFSEMDPRSGPRQPFLIWKPTAPFFYLSCREGCRLLLSPLWACAQRGNRTSAVDMMDNAAVRLWSRALSLEKAFSIRIEVGAIERERAQRSNRRLGSLVKMWRAAP
jgi:hypothetical protein